MEMFKPLALALTIVASATLGVATASAQGITLGEPSYGGTGCPAGSVGVSLSPDATSLSLLFDTYVVEAGGTTGRSFDRKACNVAIPVSVPQGYSVTINFTNSDPTQPHSLGIDESQESWPATFDAPEPAFAGAISPDPTVGTAPGGTATLTFTVDAAGDYTMVCYVPGHAVAGMHIPFTVTPDGAPGATM